jgi:AcrR family transcriptional regulator
VDLLKKLLVTFAYLLMYLQYDGASMMPLISNNWSFLSTCFYRSYFEKQSINLWKSYFKVTKIVHNDKNCNALLISLISSKETIFYKIVSFSISICYKYGMKKGSGKDLPVKVRIVSEAREVFFARGFAKVKVDEIAKRLGISKKTIYSNFKSKETIVEAVMERHFTEVGAKLETVMRSTSGYMEKLYGVFAIATDTVSQVSPKFMDNLKRKRPDIWKKVEDFRRKSVLTTFSKLIEEGIKFGMIRKDLEKEVALLVLLNSVQGIINPETLSKHSLTSAEAMNGIMRIIFDGILTDTAKSRLTNLASEGER